MGTVSISRTPQPLTHVLPAVVRQANVSNLAVHHGWGGWINTEGALDLDWSTHGGREYVGQVGWRLWQVWTSGTGTVSEDTGVAWSRPALNVIHEP